MTKDALEIRPAPAAVPGIGKRQTQAAMRRQLLLETAFQLFSERGYRQTSVRDVTRAAGVTEAVLYHYFSSKSDLFISVLATYAPFTQVPNLLDTMVDASATVVLQRLGRELLSLLRTRRQLALTVLSEAPTDPDLAEALSRFHLGFARDLGGFLAHRQETGQIASDVNVFAVARAFQGGLLVHFLTTTFQTDQSEIGTDDNAAVDDLVTALDLGIHPRHSF